MASRSRKLSAALAEIPTSWTQRPWSRSIGPACSMSFHFRAPPRTWMSNAWRIAERSGFFRATTRTGTRTSQYSAWRSTTLKPTRYLDGPFRSGHRPIAGRPRPRRRAGHRHDVHARRARRRCDHNSMCRHGHRRERSLRLETRSPSLFAKLLQPAIRRIAGDAGRRLLRLRFVTGKIVRPFVVTTDLQVENVDAVAVAAKTIMLIDDRF